MHANGNFQTKVTFILKVMVLPGHFSSPSNRMKFAFLVKNARDLWCIFLEQCTGCMQREQLNIKSDTKCQQQQQMSDTPLFLLPQAQTRHLNFG